jgi:hypothetical protein
MNVRVIVNFEIQHIDHSGYSDGAEERLGANIHNDSKSSLMVS